SSRYRRRSELTLRRFRRRSTVHPALAAFVRRPSHRTRRKQEPSCAINSPGDYQSYNYSVTCRHPGKNVSIRPIENFYPASSILFFMPPRRELLKMSGAGLLALAARPGLMANALKLPSVALRADEAKMTHEPFGDLAIYFSGPTDQVQSMMAGSLLLKPGKSPHAPHQHPEEEFM